MAVILGFGFGYQVLRLPLPSLHKLSFRQQTWELQSGIENGSLASVSIGECFMLTMVSIIQRKGVVDINRRGYGGIRILTTT